MELQEIFQKTEDKILCFPGCTRPGKTGKQDIVRFLELVFPAFVFSGLRPARILCCFWRGVAFCKSGLRLFFSRAAPIAFEKVSSVLSNDCFWRFFFFFPAAPGRERTGCGIFRVAGQSWAIRYHCVLYFANTDTFSSGVHLSVQSKYEEDRKSDNYTCMSVCWQRWST